MQLIIDSGSTKCDWVYLSEDTSVSFETMGLNPLYHTAEKIEAVVQENQALYALRDRVSSIHFYGAGCATDSLKSVVEEGLKRVFSNAKIQIESDLMATIYATFRGEPAISCILGTGSNACYFDGATIQQQVPALGYILGDEGSGAYFGKELLKRFLYKQLPESLENALMEEFNLDKAQIIQHVYREPNANVYLASFVKFMVKHKTEPTIQELIYSGFRAFNQVHVCGYPNYKSIPTHYVGSVAYYFHRELASACHDQEIRLGSVLQKPMDGLIEFHRKKVD